MVFTAIYDGGASSDGDSSTATSKMVVALAFLPACFLKDLSLVSFLSMGGLVATLFTMSLVLRKATSEIEDDINVLPDPHHLREKRHLLEDVGQGLFGALRTRTESQTELVGPRPFLPLSLLLYQVCDQSWIVPEFLSAYSRIWSCLNSFGHEANLRIHD